MTLEAILALVILGLAIVLFVSDRLRLDVVAMMSLLALTISGVGTVPDALAGFSNPAVLMIAGLFIVGHARRVRGAPREQPDAHQHPAEPARE